MEFPDPKWDKLIFAVVAVIGAPILSAIILNLFLKDPAFAAIPPEKFDRVDKPKIFSLPCGRDYWLGYNITYLRKNAQFTMDGAACLDFTKRKWVFVYFEGDPDR